MSRARYWLAAAAMAAGLGVFLFTASPSGAICTPTPPRGGFAGISTLGLALVATVVAFTPMRRGTAPRRPARRPSWEWPPGSRGDSSPR